MVRPNVLSAFLGRLLVIGAFLVVLGIVMNRLNVSVTGMEAAAGTGYFPSWMDIGLSLGLVVLGFNLSTLAIQYLLIFPGHAALTEKGTGSRPMKA